MEDNLITSEDLKLSYFVLLFSHLKNEIKKKYNNTYNDKTNIKEIIENYFKTNFKIHKFNESEIIYNNLKKNNIMLSYSNFFKIIKSIDEELIESILKEHKHPKLNKTLNNNFYAAVDIFATYLKYTDNDLSKKYYEQISSIFSLNHEELNFSKDMNSIELKKDNIKLEEDNIQKNIIIEELEKKLNQRKKMKKDIF